MFLPECRTPGPVKPQLMLHNMLGGYKMQTHLCSVAPNSATQVTTAEGFQKTFQVFTV